MCMVYSMDVVQRGGVAAVTASAVGLRRDVNRNAADGSGTVAPESMPVASVSVLASACA